MPRSATPNLSALSNATSARIRPGALGRRTWLAQAAGLLVLPLGAGVAAAQPARPAAIPLEVWKSPTCGCCADWVRHMEAAGFVATVRDVGNNAARARLRMPERFGSCHTAQVQGYVIEGHVPAADVRRLLQQRPAAIGLAVPGMPIGSPGMDGPAYGNRREAYDVLLIGPDGQASVFARHA